MKTTHISILLTLLVTPVYAQVSQIALVRNPVNIRVGTRSLKTLPDVEVLAACLPSDVTMTFVRIPGGTFEMGSNNDSTWSWCYPCEKPVHRVTIGYDFYLGQTEVTQSQWLTVMGDWPGTEPRINYGLGPDDPAYNVSWDDCQEFAKRLSQMDPEGATYRLPSEAEWEYAARGPAGNPYRYGHVPVDETNCAPENCGDCALNNYAWWCANASEDPGCRPVASLQPNGYGLYDMMGNIYEWVEDWYHPNYKGAPTDGSAWVDPAGKERVLKGGFWRVYARDLRPSLRAIHKPRHRFHGAGFRVVREISGEAGTQTKTASR